jgi:alkanesulfonate monooxygenase SsuD/methylene tetrahydromethanopterin reductase-like flavin-dependent oxidoreductase (luciferase family)
MSGNHYGAPMRNDHVRCVHAPGLEDGARRHRRCRNKWQKAVDIAVRAEALGYDSIWVYDHFHNVPRPAHEAVFECWTTMAAISQRTSTVRLGQMVGCNGYRQPSVLAKITSTVDVISGGRLDWGIGAGGTRTSSGLRVRLPGAQGPDRHVA